MKKVGILTFHFANNKNFGASLQSFAILNLIKKFYGDTKIIDYSYTKFKLKHKIKLWFQGKGFLEFNKKFLTMTKNYKKEKNLKELNQYFDIFIVGSDQVWRAMGKHSPTYFLNFVDEKKKKIAYAASYGVDFWEGDKKLTKEIKELIKKFNYISVREDSGINICNTLFQVEAEVTLDPTLMLNKEDYEIILNEYKGKDHLKNKYVAYMILDDNKNLKDECENYVKQNNFLLNNIKGKVLKIGKYNIMIYNKVSKWLTLLKDAEIVITDSFHCTVFSIIFHKNFIVLANRTRGIARLESLLKKLGLEDRLIYSLDDEIRNKILEKKINYKDVDEKLKDLKKESYKFLRKALGVEE